MAPIPEHLIDRIRESVNIVDIIYRYVNLKKRGRNYLGLCPFHKEKTPSFSVSPEKQIFYCFGCGTGGNVFTFLMKYERISFIDAVKRLAHETGIQIPTSTEVKKAESENEQLYRANQIALEFYHQQLKTAPDKILNYLKSRGISENTIQAFKLGYAPDAWDSLRKFLEIKHYKVASFQKLGLLMESEKDKHLFDRFRNRLMFPIYNSSGKVVAFGGRTFSEDDSTPKYINSPESPIYRKSQILYGLFFAKDFIREAGFTLFVEGYMDFLQLFQAGIKNVVATSGTALTEEHARLIRRYTSRVILCYDADTAGISAAARGGEVLLQQSLDVEVLILPRGEDPDSFVQNHGKTAFMELIKNRSDYLKFRLQLLRDQYDLQKATERSQAVNEILEILVPLRDPIRSGVYVERIAEHLHLPPTTLLNELQKKIKTRQRRETISLSAEATTEVPQRQPSVLAFSGAWSAEKDILILLMNHFDNIHEYIFEYVNEEEFLNPEFREIFHLIKERGKNDPGNLIHLVLDSIENQSVKNLLTENLFSEIKNPARYLQDCVKLLKIARLQANIERARQKIREMESNTSLYNQLLEEMRQNMKELNKWQTFKATDLRE